MRVCVRAARGPGLVWEGGWRGRGAHRGGAREGMCALALAPPPPDLTRANFIYMA